MEIVTDASNKQKTGAARELELYFGPQHVGMVGNFGIVLTVEGDTVVRARLDRLPLECRASDNPRVAVSNHPPGL